MTKKSDAPAIRFKGFSDAWEQRKLGDVVQITMGQSPDGSTYSDEPSDYILVQGNADLQNGWVCPRIWTTQITKKADAGDLIMSVRAPAGAMGKTAYNAVIGRGVAAIKGNEFIYQLLVKMDTDGFWKTLSCGSTFESLNSDNIKNAEVKIPTTAEQKKIGGLFQYLDNLITLHQRKFEKLTNVKKSMLEKMFPQNGSSYPEIRFKGFTDPWEQRKLSEIADKVTEKNAGLQYVEIFTNSAEFGIISQRDFFDHDIAKLGSLDGYYIVKNEDFVYNPRISTSAPVGPINRNKLGRTGVMSPLYTVFRPHDVDTTYLEHFFKCAYWHSFMNFNGDSGARSDRFSIKDDVFFQMPIPLPYIDEQRKIGELLTRLDHLITLHQRQPFLHSTPEISLTVQLIHPFYTSSWEQRKLGELVDRVVRKNTNNESTLPLTISAQYGLVDQITYFNNRVASRDVSNYYLVLNGEFAYNKSTSDGYPFGAVKRLDLYEKGVLSTLYIVFAPKKEQQIDSDYLTVFFDTDRWHKGVAERAAEGARNHGLLNISAEDFFDIDLSVPKDIVEQKQIGAFIRQLDNLITLHQRKGKAAVTGCSNDANNSKGVYCKARDFGYKCCKKVESP